MIRQEPIDRLFSESETARMTEHRLARPADVADLDRICMDCFPHSLFWSGSHAATARWWESALSGDVAETWIVTEGEKPAGLAVMLLDEAAWRDRHAGARMTPREIAARALRHPGRLARAIAKRARPDARPELPMRPFDLATGRRLFVEHFAVSPQMRRKGIGRDLVRLSLRRAAAHGFDGAYYLVDRDNDGMLALLVREGFTVQRDAGRQLALAHRTEVPETAASPTTDADRDTHETLPQETTAHED